MSPTACARDATGRWHCARKPRRCPACGAASVAGILYGYPMFSPELESQLAAGRVVLGGCCVTDDDPRWHCTTCGTDLWGPSPPSDPTLLGESDNPNASRP